MDGRLLSDKRVPKRDAIQNAPSRHYRTGSLGGWYPPATEAARQAGPEEPHEVSTP